MADPAALRRPPRILESAMVRALPPIERYILRGDQAVLNAAALALALNDPPGTCRAAVGGEHAWLWLGPDERLVLAAVEAATPVPALLQQALQGLAHALVDVGHRQVALELAGPGAATVLATGCPLDLRQDEFPIGMCTRTVLAKAEIVLWRTAQQNFHIEVARSFAEYLSLFLAESQS